MIEGRIQAEIMRYLRQVDRPVSRSEMTEVFGVSRSKISMEVGRLLEAGLLVEDGLAESEMADVLGVAPGTVKSRLHRARAAFRARWTA